MIQRLPIWQSLYMIVTIALCFLLSVTTTILVAPFFYRLWLIPETFTHITGLSKEIIYSNFYEMWLFLVHPQKDVFYLPDFSSSQGAIQHFYEVKSWFMLVFIFTILLFILWLVLKIKNHRQTFRLPRIDVWFNGAALLPLALLLIAVVGFDQLFLWMHELLFQNDLWLFDPYTDPIINVLPQSFFFGSLIVIVLFYEMYLYIMMFYIRS